MAELKMAGIELQVDQHCYTSQLVYHQMLFKGCNSIEEFE